MKAIFGLAVVLAAGAAFGSECIVNPGFEYPAITSANQSFFQGSTAIPGWTVDAASPSQGVTLGSQLFSSQSFAWRGHQGLMLGGACGPGRIYQEFTLAPFENYILEIGTTGETSPATDTYSVYWNNNFWFTSGQTTNGSWYLSSYLMQGTAVTNGRLEIRSETATNGIVLDEIHLYKYNDTLLHGTITLFDFMGSTTGIPLTIEFRNHYTNELLYTENTTLNPAGQYEVQIPQGPSFGLYDITYKAPHFLRKTLTNVGLYNQLNEKDLAMVNGDVDDSGEVDAADIDAVIMQFGSVDPTNADVDGSGEVDAADIDLVIMNFGAVDA